MRSGWDRFGRVQRQMWVDGLFDEHASLSTAPNGPPLVELTHTYDVASNRLTRVDDRPGAGYANKDYHYLYDGLDRLIEVERGVWNGSSMTLGVRSQEWSLDMPRTAKGHVLTRLKRQRSRWTHLTSWPRSRFGLVWSVRK